MNKKLLISQIEELGYCIENLTFDFINENVIKIFNNCNGEQVNIVSRDFNRCAIIKMSCEWQKYLECKLAKLHLCCNNSDCTSDNNDECQSNYDNECCEKKIISSSNCDPQPTNQTLCECIEQALEDLIEDQQNSCYPTDESGCQENNADFYEHIKKY